MPNHRSPNHRSCAPAGLALLGLVAAMLDAHPVLGSESLGSCRPRGTSARGLDLRKPCPETPPVDAGSSRRNVPPGNVPLENVPLEKSPMSSVPARSASVPQDSEAEAAPLDHWYGWQTLIADTASFGAFLGGSAIASAQEEKPGGDVAWGQRLSVLGAVGYLAAAPVIHGLHERSAGRVAGSVTLRLGLPLLGVLAGAALEDCEPTGPSGSLASTGETFCEVGAAGTGLLLGLVAAVAVDSVLSFEPSPVERGPIGFTPSFIATGDRAELGVAGWF